MRTGPPWSGLGWAVAFASEQRLALLDGALALTAVQMLLTDQTVLSVHLIFALLSVEAFFVRLRPFLLRSLFWVVLTTMEVLRAVLGGVTKTEELIEIPLLATIFVVVLVMAGRREAALRDAERRALLDDVLEHTTDAVVASDESGRLLHANRAARLLGLGQASAEETARFFLVDGATQVRDDELPLARALRGEQVRGQEIALKRRAHVPVVLAVDATPMRDRAGRLVGAVALLRDITERKRIEQQMTYRALHDPLTGLANRALFLDRLQATVERQRRLHEIFALMFLDLDDFKDVNDRLGHAAGDALLVEVGHRLRAAVRPMDTVGRLGGDEFVILLDSVSGGSEATKVAGRVTGRLSPPFVIEGRPCGVHASLGVVVSTGGHEPEELIRYADVAMYAAKGGGKGRYEVFDRAVHASLLGSAGSRVPER